MTNYSFEPPAKKAMDEAELSELISGLSADESGIEKAMKILQEQETLRSQDEQNFQEWRESLLVDGSVEALRAIEKVTGEVLVEPEPEPEPESTPEPEPESGEKSSESTDARDQVDEEEFEQSEEHSQSPQTDLEQDGEAEKVSAQETEVSQDQESEQTSVEFAVSESKTAETEIVDSETIEETVVESFEEEVQISTQDDQVEVEYRTAITTVSSIVPAAGSFEQAVVEGVLSRPRRIRQHLSSKFVLGVSLATAIFSSLVMIGSAYFDGSQWSNLGTLAGVLLGFGLFALHGFQKTSFSTLVSQSLGNFSLYWQLGVLVSVSLLLVPASNLFRDNSFFRNLDVQPAQIFEYLLDEVSLTVIFAVVLAAILAWQPMLRFGLLRLLAFVGIGSVVAMLSDISSNETSFGDWQYQEFLLGLAVGLVLVVSLSLVAQPNFASDHERPSWAVGEFASRKNRASVLHSVLFVLLPGLLAFGVLSSSELGNSEWTQTGLLVAAGVSIFVALLGVLNKSNIYLKLLSLILVSAGLIAGEYLTNEAVQGLAVIGLVLLTSLIGSALVIRFILKESNYPWLIILSSTLGVVVGWLIENPFGLLDLGFSGYQDLQGAGLGYLAALLLAGVVTLAGIKRARSNEDS